MKKELKDKLKKVLTDSIRNFFKRKIEEGISTSNILDILFPQERRIRSLIGGLETSMGTTVWEVMARELAVNNGFEIIPDKQILMPQPFPNKLNSTLQRLINSRSNGHLVSTDECIAQLRQASQNIDRDNLSFVAPPKGMGIDLYLKKNVIEYIFDLKSSQANVGDFSRYNRQLLHWYAYRFAKDPTVQLKARIAFTFNHFPEDWYKKQKSKIATHLDPDCDIFVENEFWDFCSGYKDTSSIFTSLFEELRDENFHEEFHDIFYDS
ncbi:MAG: TdeIII family type II restriction endonuclease [Symploca sp. SIO2E6]|nr:TdeIII family type II restriction endonuclease [Symploca sp. SIO2E6]